MRFMDRRDAGQRLAGRLAGLKGVNTVVLALPRGGVPVAYQVAHALGVPLEVMLVRKLGVPIEPEIAMGAITEGPEGGEPVVVLDEATLSALRISPTEVDRVIAGETRELDRRRRLYRDGRPAPDLAGKTAILVDDGIATGATMRAAVRAARQRHAAAVVVAVPVAATQSLGPLAAEADEIACLKPTETLVAVGYHYVDFQQVSDEEVMALLHDGPRATGERPPPRPPTGTAS
ncbi:phosphoribosyltransferase [Nitrospirillum viridazoti]|uniref:Phosphoribosyltransferase n=1 Tax=Nitrospirillum viridazoti CBAmc TaxID=1441467 RepID=A0A248K107_9PROT|nr:phosphoribosyltransferase family protein [Nitrospirillum amazonense]ASG24479.1 phosphoribosyltransferase [Nitrospirillum amazonense CBAmc]TWB37177.1 putative phosphoribosyltransferase [Nitrospirillum amazonense]